MCAGLRRHLGRHRERGTLHSAHAAMGSLRGSAGGWRALAVCLPVWGGEHVCATEGVSMQTLVSGIQQVL